MPTFSNSVRKLYDFDWGISFARGSSSFPYLSGDLNDLLSEKSHIVKGRYEMHSMKIKLYLGSTEKLLGEVTPISLIISEISPIKPVPIKIAEGPFILSLTSFATSLPEEGDFVLYHC